MLQNLKGNFYQFPKIASEELLEIFRYYYGEQTKKNKVTFLYFPLYGEVVWRQQKGEFNAAHNIAAEWGKAPSFMFDRLRHIEGMILRYRKLKAKEKL